MLITGARGTGKTTVVPALCEVMPNFDVFDIDVIHKEVGDWQKLKNIWLTVESHITKSNRITIEHIARLLFPSKQFIQGMIDLARKDIGLPLKNVDE